MATMTTYGTIPTSSSGGTKFEFLSRAKHLLKAGLGTRRSWKQMFQIRSINFPSGFNDAIGRIKTNVGYFRMNYVIMMLYFPFLTLLWNPTSLIVFVAFFLFLYLILDEPPVIFHRLVDDRVVLIVLSIVTVVLLLLTGATVNIVVSVLVALVVVAIHAALRKTDDLFLDEEAVETGGLLTSFP